MLCPNHYSVTPTAGSHDGSPDRARIHPLLTHVSPPPVSMDFASPRLSWATWLPRHIGWSAVVDGLPERSDWDGLIRDRADPSEGVSLAIVVGTPNRSWSSPVRVTGDDGRDYFAKFPELCRSLADRMSVVTEMVVSRAGRLIQASTCETVVMRVPEEIQGELINGVAISSRLVHASVALDKCDDKKPALPSRAYDDNRRRHATLFALYDWFMGCDQQWLRDLEDDMAVYSHDHGLYLPPVGAGYWTEHELVSSVDAEWQLPDDVAGLSQAGLSDTADALRQVTREDLRSLLTQVPLSWPVTDAQLECLGWFLERRAPAVAGRIERIASSQGA